MIELLLLVLVLVGISLGFGVPVYNRVHGMRENLRSADKTFNATLKRKSALAQSIVNLAYAAAAHERSTFESVARASNEAAREMARSAHPTLILANLSTQFPQLNHVVAFREAQLSALSIEQQIGTDLAKRNSLADQYNTAIATFPDSIVTTLLGFEAAEYRDDWNESGVESTDTTPLINDGRGGKRVEIERRLDAITRQDKK